MNKYNQLTVADRKVVETFLMSNYSVKEIAEVLCKNRTTISREISRCPSGKYSWELAELHYQAKRSNSRYEGKVMNYGLKEQVIGQIWIGWSPEQVKGRLELAGISCPCIETLYRFVYRYPPNIESKLYQYLRYGRKKRKKQHGRRVQTEKIANKVSIHARPINVLSRREFGHFEGDSVLYPNKRAISTLNDLKTGLVSFILLNGKTAVESRDALVTSIKKYYKCKSLTLDNGTEFMEHQSISEKTGVAVYFCDPYAPYQRGANENVNMLLRGYLPKGRQIDDLTQEELDDIAYELNNRPRKRLGFLTPLEAYLKDLNK